MDHRRSDRWSRREFVGGLTVAGTAGLLGIGPPPVAAEPPPETTRIRLGRSPFLCKAPQYMAEELLRAEGFTDVQYVDLTMGTVSVSGGAVDFSQLFSPDLLVDIDGGQPIAILAGVHIGCYELLGRGRVRTIRDLKGKSCGLWGPAAPTGGRPSTAPLPLGLGQLFVASMASYVGLNSNKDINWVTHPEATQLFAEGKVDACLGFPFGAQEMRPRKSGRAVNVVVSSTTDRPWSQQFCCVLAGNRDFVRKHPVATKRVMRALLKTADICAQDPERAARFLVDRGYTTQYDYALQVMQEIPYSKWREYDPEATVRFYALRLHETGLIKSSPKKIIAESTDWRFLNELKRELKA